MTPSTSHPILLFLTALPLWQAFLVMVVLPTVLAIGGLRFVQRRFDHEALAANNEVAGFEFATIGVIYSVLLAFAVIVVWEKFSDAEVAVRQEAGAAATVLRLTSRGDTWKATREALTNYVEQAVARDWPCMAAEHESDAVRKDLDGLYSAAVQATEIEPRHVALSFELLKQLDTITQSRLTRNHLAKGIVPRIMWIVLFCGAVLTVCFTFFFCTRNPRAQTTMTGILSFLVFLGLLVMVEIDHPFTGPTSVSPEPLEIVAAEVERHPKPGNTCPDPTAAVLLEKGQR